MIKNTGQHHATGIFSELTYKSGVSLAEFIHELSQFFSAFIGHGVVDGGAHAATLRWLLTPLSPSCRASATNFALSSSLGRRKAYFFRLS